MANRMIINSASSLSEAMAMLSARFRDQKYLVISVREGRDRTADQNALWFALYERIAQMTSIGDVDDARRYCKLHLGVPIMRRDCAEFRDGWNRLFLSLRYEDKLALMAGCPLFGPDGFPVTRLFNRKQGIEYTDRIVAEFAGRGVFFADILGESAA